MNIILEPFILSYYELEKTEKARKVFEETSAKYQSYVAYYGAMSMEEQAENLQEIYSKLNQYESLVEIVYVYDTDEYYQQQKQIFKNYLLPFKGLFERLDMNIDTEFLQKERLTEKLLDSLLNDSVEE